MSARPHPVFLNKLLLDGVSPRFATKLKFVTSIITSGSRNWSRYFSEIGSPFVRIANLKREALGLRLDDLQFVTPPEEEEG